MKKKHWFVLVTLMLAVISIKPALHNMIAVA